MAEACYVYTIVGRGAVLPPGMMGFQNRPLTLVRWKDLAAVVSEVAGDTVRPAVEDATRHESIVEAVRSVVPALPVRFGTILPDATSVERALERQYEVLVSDLDRLGDKLEFGLSMLWNEDEPDTESPGRSTEPAAAQRGKGRGSTYLWERVDETRRDHARRSRAQSVADALDAVLRPCAIDQRRTLLPTQRLAVRAAYLVQRDSEGTFKAAFQSVRRIHPDLRLLLTGPWPPYSFVSGGQGALSALFSTTDQSGTSITHDARASALGEQQGRGDS